MPAAIITNPGPGKTSKAMPTNRTVPPTSATITFFIEEPLASPVPL